MALLEQDVFQKAVEFFRKAGQFAREGEFKQFASLAEEGWKVFPDPKSQWNQGYTVAKGAFCICLEYGEAEEAKKWLDRMIENNDELHNFDTELFHMKAKYHFETQEYQAALELWKQLVKKVGLRYFEGEDKKYLNFYRNPDSLLK